MKSVSPGALYTWGNLYTLQISFPNSRIFPSTSIQHAVYGGTCTYRLCIHCSCVWIRIHTGTEFSQFVDPYSECGSTFTQVKKKLMQKIEDNNSLFRIRNSKFSLKLYKFLFPNWTETPNSDPTSMNPDPEHCTEPCKAAREKGHWDKI